MSKALSNSRRPFGSRIPAAAACSAYQMTEIATRGSLLATRKWPPEPFQPEFNLDSTKIQQKFIPPGTRFWSQICGPAILKKRAGTAARAPFGPSWRFTGRPKPSWAVSLRFHSGFTEVSLRFHVRRRRFAPSGSAKKRSLPDFGAPNRSSGDNLDGFSAANRWKLCPTGGVRHRFWKQHSDAAHAGNCAETAARAPNSNFRDPRKQTFMKMFGGAALSKRLQLVRPAPGRHFEAASTEGTRQEGHQGCHGGPKSPSRSLEARARASERATKKTQFFVK